MPKEVWTWDKATSDRCPQQRLNLGLSPKTTVLLTSPRHYFKDNFQYAHGSSITIFYLGEYCSFCFRWSWVSWWTFMLFNRYMVSRESWRAFFFLRFLSILCFWFSPVVVVVVVVLFCFSFLQQESSIYQYFWTCFLFFFFFFFFFF